MPDEITHAIIDPSVKTVRRRAFYNRWRWWQYLSRQQLVSVIFHDGVEIIEKEAFYNCESLRGITLTGVKQIGGGAFRDCRSLSGTIQLPVVREIGYGAFDGCFALSGVEFGDELETVGSHAFSGCGLRSIKMPTVRTVQHLAFAYCRQLTDVEFGSNLETVEISSFSGCERLRRIAIPLKDDMLHRRYDEDGRELGRSFDQFNGCHNLTTVDLVGKIHNTISSLLVQRWRDEIYQEIDRINVTLPNTPADEKTEAIRLWIRSVINTVEQYKAQHNTLLKEECMPELVLAIWKATLDETGTEGDCNLREQTMIFKFLRLLKLAPMRSNAPDNDTESVRREKLITSGASVIIKNVLPFLEFR